MGLGIILLVTGAGAAATAVARRLGQRRRVPPATDITPADEPPSTPTADEAVAERESEEEVDRYLMASVASLGLATGGLAIPILGPVSALGIMYSSVPILRGARREIIDERRFGIDGFNCLAAVAMVASGFFAASAWSYSLYFVAEKLRLRAQDRSRNDLTRSFLHRPEAVWQVIDGVEVQVPFTDIGAGAVLALRAGEVVPVDGQVVWGAATLDQRVLTGESQPVERGPGEPVLASTMVQAGHIHVRVDRTGEDAVASRIAAALTRTLDYKATAELRSESIANHLATPTVLLSGLALPLVGKMGAATILNAYAGDSIRVVAPIAVLNYLGFALDRGVLVKDGRALEMIPTIDTVVFDKTGTLTEDVPHVVAVHALAMPEDDLLALAAAAEFRQTHPIAKAILAEAAARGIAVPEPDAAAYAVGFGLEVEVHGRTVRVGSARFMHASGVDRPPRIEAVEARSRLEATSLVHVAVDGACAGAIELRATTRPEAAALVRSLRERGYAVHIISGDHETPTRRLAELLGVDGFHAGVLPEDKADLIAAMQAEGRSVCFIGDGINDAIALKKADVSISLSGASTIATDTAQIVLLDGTLGALETVFDVGRSLTRNVDTSLAITLGLSAGTIGGALFMGMGVMSAIWVYNAGLIVGVANSMRPALERRRSAGAEQPSLPATAANGDRER